jgi:hypothetical protein
MHFVCMSNLVIHPEEGTQNGGAQNRVLSTVFEPRRKEVIRG